MESKGVGQFDLARFWASLEPQIDLLLTLPPDAQERWLEQYAHESAEGAAHLRALLAARDAASRASFLSGSAAEALLPSPEFAIDRVH